MSNDINVGAISEALNNKLDRNGMNAGNPCSVVIKTFVDGTSGYRIWSDGYCEQWGISKNSSDHVINLLKTYKDIDYICTLNNYAGDYPNQLGKIWVATSVKTVNSFTAYSYDVSSGNRTSGLYWITRGYLAEGEY